MFAVAEAEVYS